MAKNWTEDDEQYIRDNFLDTTYSDLADHFEVSTKAMESKIRRMGLKKQEALAEAEEEEDAVRTEPVPVEESKPTPIESLQGLPRKSGEVEETAEEREARIEATLQAAEREKARRQEEREDDGMSDALKKLEAGMKKMMAGDLEKALSDFEKILDSRSDPAVAARAEQFVEACNLQIQKAPPKPESADDFYQLGVLQMNDGDFEAALESFAAAAEKGSEADHILYCRAAAYAQSGDVESALDALRRAVEKNDANRIYAKNDSDFTPLRVHEDFQDLVAPPEEEEDSEEAA